MTGANGHDLNKSTDIAIGIFQDKVVIHWHAPTTSISFDPQRAFEFGEQMARTAHKARFGEEVENDGKYLSRQIRQRMTEDLRDKMITRVRVMLPSLLDSKNLDYTARSIVDTIFSEVA
jgi:hypothetical protein